MIKIEIKSIKIYLYYENQLPVINFYQAIHQFAFIMIDFTTKDIFF